MLHCGHREVVLWFWPFATHFHTASNIVSIKMALFSVFLCTECCYSYNYRSSLMESSIPETLFFMRTHREARGISLKMAKRSPELYHKHQETKYTSRREGVHFSSLIFIYSRVAAAPNIVRTRQHTHLRLVDSFFVHFVQDITQLAREMCSERHENTHARTQSLSLASSLLCWRLSIYYCICIYINIFYAVILMMWCTLLRWLSQRAWQVHNTYSDKCTI